MEHQLLKSERLCGIGESAVMVAPDLRNPMQSIATGIYFLKKNPELSNETKIVMLKNMENGDQYADKIVTD
jgi:hypothetical protein